MRFVKLILIITMLSGSVGLQAASDRYGSSDHPLLKRYPRAWIVNYSQAQAPDYRWALGALEKVNGVVSAEQEQRSAGLLTRISYRLPAGVTPAEAMRFMIQQLKAKGGVEKFSCQGRACGSSHQWANQVFRFAKLYGVERTQFYSAWQKNGQLVSLYAVQRGNKRVYLHLDLLQQAGTATQPSTPISLVDQLRQQGYIRWPAEEPEALLGWLRSSNSRIWLVGHLRAAGKLSDLQSRSLRLADQVADRLKATGVDGARIETFGMGPLAPGLVGPNQQAVFLILKPE